jgi:hypothetical protein
VTFEEVTQCKIRDFGELTIKGTSFSNGSRLVGWRVTAVDQSTGYGHEYWVQDGRMFHVQLATSPPWTHRTPFVIGDPVKRVEPSAKAAVLQAVEEWSLNISK